MIDVDKTDTTAELIDMQVKISTAGVSSDLFDGVSNILLSTGIVTAKKAQTWSKRTYAYQASKTNNVRTKRLLKLRALSEKGAKAPRKAVMYSRMTAGLSLMS